MKTKCILVAPLDWGLGHATRCIPIIELLINKGFEVHIASSGSALTILKETFPGLKSFILPSYHVRYSRYWPFMIKVFLQLPKFLWVIAREKSAVKKLARRNSYDLLISDNRYGCRLSTVKSVFIGHQINLIMPNWLAWLSPVINYFNHRWISKFDECWIPDDPQNSLTGILTRPALPRSKWIGVISRFNKGMEVKKEYQLVVVLSGPEPQRSLFEKIILKQIRQIDQRTLLVCGVMDGTGSIDTPPYVEVVNYLNKNKLQQAIAQGEWILARPGYTTVMDLYVMGKKAIFVPTPGQTEQEYLGGELMKKGIAFCMTQNEFDMGVALNEVKNYTGFEGKAHDSNLLNLAIEEALQ